MLAWQHSALETVRLSLRARPASPALQPRPPEVELRPPPPPLAASTAIHFADGESIGNASRARLCVVMPVRSNNLRNAVRNVRSWSSARGLPCTTTAEPQADLCIFHSQSFVSARDVGLANDLLLALQRPQAAAGAEAPHSASACFGAVRFLAARIPLDVDVYTIYPTHNFTGPNTHFLTTFAALERVAAAGLARYAAFQIMETDTYAFRPGWAEALGTVAGRRRKEWVLGARSLCLRPTEVEHINGNALYANDRAFVHELRRELAKRMDSWAFDVLIGRWLLRRHPHRIRESAHVLSISTFQRNRSCCELVRSLVDGGTRRDGANEPAVPHGVGRATEWPGLFLLHTGNIGKLRDSSVPPSMRALGLALQDLFVPRSDEPCTLASTLPPHLAKCLASTQPWRTRLKGQGDCKLIATALVPLLWAPRYPIGGAPAAAAMVRMVQRTFALGLRVLDAAGDGVGGSSGNRDRHGGEDNGADDSVASVENGVAAGGFVASQLPSLLSQASTTGGGGQLVVLLSPPAASLWRAFQAARARAVSTGETAPGLADWVRSTEPNPLVTALAQCGRVQSGGSDLAKLSVAASESDQPLLSSSRELSTGANASTSAEALALEAAKTVLQERVLSVVLEPNATQRSLTLLEGFFGWARRLPPHADRGVSAAASAGPNDAGGADGAQPVLLTGEDELPPAEAMAILKTRVGMDMRLYDFAARLAAEQHRSVVWAEDAADTCAVAEIAGEAAAAMRAAPITLALEVASTFTWDGDAYRVYELTVPTPPHAVTLLLRGKNVIGTAPFTVNVLISHRTSRPSFAERAFRYVFESRPPHRRAGKFVLGAERLHACCIDAASAAADANTSAACTSRPFTLWIALKCRSTAVSTATITATSATIGARA
jgi:hypothetical protein